MESNALMKKSIMWNTVGNVYFSFCQWLMTVLIVYMSKDNYWPVGMLGLAMSVTNSFASIASFGMRSFQISDITKVYSNEDYIMSRRITCAVAYIACVVYSVIVCTSPMEIICILIYMCMRIVESAEDVYQGVLQTNWRFDIIGKSYIMRGTLQLASFVVVFLLTREMYITFIFIALSDWLVFQFYDKKQTRNIAGIGKVKYDARIIKLLKSCAGLVVYYFMASSFATVVRVSIKQKCGIEELGIYSTVASPTVIIQLTASVIYSPFIPGIARTFFDGNKEKFIGYIKKISLIIVAAFVVLNIGGYLLGHWGLELLYNPSIAAHDEYLIPLIWCTFFAAAVWFFAGMLIAIRKSVQLLIAVTISFILNFVINRPLISAFGPNGGSYSQVIAEVLLMIILIVMLLFDVHNIEKGDRNVQEV